MEMKLGISSLVFCTLVHSTVCLLILYFFLCTIFKEQVQQVSRNVELVNFKINFIMAFNVVPSLLLVHGYITNINL